MKINPLARRQALSFNHAAGYVFRDGLIVNVDEQVKGKHGASLKQKVAYINRGNILISENTPWDKPRRVKCLIVYDAKALLDGIKSVDVYYNNHSPSMEKQGLTCNTITYTTDSGAQHREHIWSFISGDWFIGEEHAESVDEWLKAEQEYYPNLTVIETRQVAEHKQEADRDDLQTQNS